VKYSNIKSCSQEAGHSSSLHELKILVVAPLPPRHSGGVERVVGEIAEQLTVGTNVKVEIYSGDLTSSACRVWNGITVKTYKTKEWRRQAPLALPKAIKTIQRISISCTHADAVHSFPRLLRFRKRRLNSGFTPLSSAGVFSVSII
jgi:hypothetical protein